ncbi:hypothetical protein E2562_034248 [Oryza meyeriana var. granulata]|uniref:Uncharacterized protein n=1 Tax=Oryza meyeriana var. granulata TaxID=110450 RepID=A0A6G1C965_9ORYZ|nr:hypothetical protein E2562_034248 [Oryza meyeriana var. granulata]
MPPSTTTALRATLKRIEGLNWTAKSYRLQWLNYLCALSPSSFASTLWTNDRRGSQTSCAVFRSYEKGAEPVTFSATPRLAPAAVAATGRGLFVLAPHVHFQFQRPGACHSTAASQALRRHAAQDSSAAVGLSYTRRIRHGRRLDSPGFSSNS